MCLTNDGIEDTEHFLLLCPSLAVPRRDLLTGVFALFRLFYYILKCVYANFPENDLEQWRDNGVPPAMTIYGLRTVTPGGVFGSRRESLPVLPLGSRCEIGGGFFFPFFFAEKTEFPHRASDSDLLHFSLL